MGHQNFELSNEPNKLWSIGLDEPKVFINSSYNTASAAKRIKGPDSYKALIVIYISKGLCAAYLCISEKDGIQIS